MQVGTEGDQPEVVTRNDQLTMKSASKAARRDKVAKNKKKKRSNKGKKNAKKGNGKKGRKRQNPTQVPAQVWQVSPPRPRGNVSFLKSAVLMLPMLWLHMRRVMAGFRNGPSCAQLAMRKEASRQGSRNTARSEKTQLRSQPHPSPRRSQKHVQRQRHPPRHRQKQRRKQRRQQRQRHQAGGDQPGDETLREMRLTRTSSHQK